MDVLVMVMMVMRVIIIVLYQRDMGLNSIIPQCLYYENNDDGVGHDDNDGGEDDEDDDGDNGDSDVHEDGADANLQVPRALSQDGDEHGE